MDPTGHDLRNVEEYLDIAELAARLGVRIGHLRALVAKHEIPFVKVGRLLRFRWADVRESLAASSVKALRPDVLEVA